MGVINQGNVPIPDVYALARAIFLADRFSPRPKGQGVEISVELPVDDTLRFDRFSSAIAHVLNYATGDVWNFSSRKSGSDVQLQSLSASFDSAVLWSGGIDALVGAIEVLNAGAGSVALISIGNNANAIKIQRDLAEKLRSLYPGKKLQHFPVQMMVTDSGKGRNPEVRARGVCYQIIGGLLAWSLGLNQVVMAENGIGALNIPLPTLTASETSWSAHPTVMRDVSTALAGFIESDFQVHNPYLYRTKGEMCEVFHQVGGAELVNCSRSCDQGRNSWLVNSSGCGWCTSCLLRRVSLAWAQVEDRGEYNGVPNLALLRSVSRQMARFHEYIDSGNFVNQMISLYPVKFGYAKRTLDDNGSEFCHNISGLYSRYVRELKTGFEHLCVAID